MDVLLVPWCGWASGQAGRVLPWQDAVVDVLACGHAAYAGQSRMCRHLLGSEGEEHVRLLTGRGLEFDLCCPACDRAAQDGSPLELVQACEGCVARCTDDEWSLLRWRGEPEILIHPEPFDATVTQVALPAAAEDLAPVTDGSRPVWLLLTGDGQIGRFDVSSGAWDLLARVTVPAEPGHKPWNGRRLRRRLHADPRGDFAAVVNDYGHHGQVIDLRTGAVTYALEGGSYHPGTVPFSLAFTRHQGRVVVIHRTAWNRLDIRDAGTGELLTSRGPTSYRRGEPRPEHYLDYFHGALLMSPGGHWVADDGWVWHPVGMPAVWDAHSWLSDYVWESEDGQTRRTLCQRGYHWDTPMCWIGDDLLAISGIGSDDEAMLQGVRIFNVSTGAEAGTFAGRQVPYSLPAAVSTPQELMASAYGTWRPENGPEPSPASSRPATWITANSPGSAMGPCGAG